MIKQMVEWTGHDGRPTSKTFYFDISEWEVSADIELEKLEERFRKFDEEVIQSSESREMTPPEVREMLGLIKTIIRHAYGVRSEDGKRFSKKAEHWDEFVETGGFDAFVKYLFSDPNRANEFMRGIWPKEFQEAMKKPQDAQNDDPAVDIPSIVPGEVVEKPWHEMSEDELLALTDDEFDDIVNNAKQGKNIPFALLSIGQRRKTGGQGE